jgi:hypothetical protein
MGGVNSESRTGDRRPWMRRLGMRVAFALAVGLASAAESRAQSAEPFHNTLGTLKVHASQRYLVHEDGTPFFYLGDTAWELFHRLTREEADRYLENRRAKGFNVIQAVALAELDGIDTPNAYGHRPLTDRDPARPLVAEGPDNDYWDHVEHIVDRAAEKGLYIGLLPTWGAHVLPKWAKDPVIFTEANAYAYGRFIGTRFAEKRNIIWILGGDRPVVDGDVTTLPIWRAMARGVREADPHHLVSYHPMGGTRTSTWLHDETWLDFHMMQSGHGARHTPAWDWVDADLNLPRPKPTLDSEINYEDHPINWNALNGYFRDTEVRAQAYRTVFAGAMGVTYGNQCIWQMYDAGRTPVAFPEMPWHEAIDRPGAEQMGHLRRLMESRPFLTARGDQAILAANAPNLDAHIRALRGDGFVFVYLPVGQSVRLSPGVVQGRVLTAWWFDPRTGQATRIGEAGGIVTASFDPPGEPAVGNDWVLVLDEGDRSWPPPGQRD